MEGTTDGGKLNETITIQAAGTPYVTATLPSRQLVLLT